MLDFTLAVGQWPVVDDRDANLARAETSFRRAAAAGAPVVLLPEMFQTPYDTETMRRRAEPEDGPTLRRIRALCRELRLTAVAGSFCEARGGRLYNSAFVLGPDGSTLGVHRKIHLFDVDLPGVQVRESSVLSAGEAPLVLDTPLARIGVAVCYDLRFHDVFRAFERRGVEVALLPAAFSETTGRAHWHALLRSRAIDYQMWVAAACPAPTPGAAYQAYGHSLVADPWGDVVAEAGTGEETIAARLGADRLLDVRRRLPLLAHRRPDLYRHWER